MRAFNADVPYDQFAREQIAGDLLPTPRRHPTDGTNESLVGTGFWHLHDDVHAPTDVRQAEAIRYDNQIDVFGKTFLGLTVACARCHDHKFDAITAADYYALAGYLKSSRREDALLDPHGEFAAAVPKLAALRTAARTARRHSLATSPADPTEVAALLTAAAEVVFPRNGTPLSDAERQSQITAAAATRGLIPELLAAWVAALSESVAAGPSHPLFPFVARAGGKESPEGIAARLAEAARRHAESRSQGQTVAPFDRWFATGWAFESGGSAGLANSRHLAPQLAGTLRSPNLVLDGDSVFIHARGSGGRVRVIVDGYQMDAHQKLLFGGLIQKVDSGDNWRWVRLAGDLGNYRGHRIYVELLDDGPGWLEVDEVRTGSGPEPPLPPSAVAISFMPEELADPAGLAAAYGRRIELAAHAAESEERSPAASELLAFLTRRTLLRPGDGADRIEKLYAEADALAASLPTPQRVLAMCDGPGCDELLFVRGSHANTAGEVPRRFLEALDGPNQPPPSDCGRLQLADRVLSADNPFPARVMVNRIWQHLFGEGIVKSVDNFGVLGDEPTHPALLDHLATSYRADGWSTKRLIRRLMLTRAYRMDSVPNPATGLKIADLDPGNRLLHAQRMRRLEGEALRDAVLVVSGRFNPQLGGEPVPVHLTPFLSGRGRPGASGPLDGDGRRSLYLSVRRNFLVPMLTAFDFPVPATTVGRRNTSNVPAQALILLNDPFIFEESKRWAEQALSTPNQTPEQRIAALYEAAYSRPPSESETAVRSTS